MVAFLLSASKWILSCIMMLFHYTYFSFSSMLFFGEIPYPEEEQ